MVNRADGNNVTILDDRTFIAKVQFGTGPGSNPQDVVVYADKLFVPAFGTAGVVVLSRTSIGDRSVIERVHCASISLHDGASASLRIAPG